MSSVVITADVFTAEGYTRCRQYIIILRHTYSIIVLYTEIELGTCIPLFSSLAIPLNSFREVLENTYSIIVLNTENELGVCIPCQQPFDTTLQLPRSLGEHLLHYRT
jgi:hypothetical protein